MALTAGADGAIHQWDVQQTVDDQPWMTAVGAQQKVGGGKGVVRVRACLVAIQPHARSQSTRSPLANSGLIHCASGAARSAMYWAHNTKTTLPRDDAASLYACASAIDCVRAIPHAKGGAHQIGSHLIRWRVCSEASQIVSMAPMNMMTK